LPGFAASPLRRGSSAVSVVKRITRLEEQIGTQPIVRSTRGLSLTPAGEKLLPQFTRLIAELEDTITGTTAEARGIEGHLRIKAPTTVTSLYLGSIFSDFQVENPGVSLEIVLLDRSVNPLEEGFDMAVGARPASYPGVVDVPLCPYPLALCCSPAYMRERRQPAHPTELVDIAVTLPPGRPCSSHPPRAVEVEVHCTYANDSRVLPERRGSELPCCPAICRGDLRTATACSVRFPLVNFAEGPVRD
jgi:DNA-binding transcriptional LysR family regulator